MNFCEDKSLWSHVKWEQKIVPVRLIAIMRHNNLHIKSLHCNSRCEKNIWTSNFNRMLWSVTNLERVNLFNYRILFELNWLQHAVGITTLIVSGCNNMSGQSFVNGVQHLCYLKCLEAMYCGHRLVAYELVIAVQNCNQLQVLNCHKTGNMRPWMVVCAMRSCPVLHTFYFSLLHRNDSTQE